MERYAGLDVGTKTIGISISDPMFITAQGLTTLKRTNIHEDIAYLQSLIEEYSISKIVVGLPKNMNNTIGPQGKKVLDFVKTLKKKTEVEIIMEDERLTTVAAEKLLIEGNVRREKRKKIVDKVAATYILQMYLDRG